MFQTLESKNCKIEELVARQKIAEWIMKEKWDEFMMASEEYRSLHKQIVRVVGSAAAVSEKFV